MTKTLWLVIALVAGAIVSAIGMHSINKCEAQGMEWFTTAHGRIFCEATDGTLHGVER